MSGQISQILVVWTKEIIFGQKLLGKAFVVKMTGPAMERRVPRAPTKLSALQDKLNCLFYYIILKFPAVYVNHFCQEKLLCACSC